MQNMQKMCIGFPATYRNQCMECRVLEMRNIYERDRVGRFGKRELEVEHRRLQKKLRKVNVYDLYDADISESDPSNDDNYVEETPVKQKRVSLTQKMKVKKVISHIEGSQDKEEETERKQMAKQKEKEKTESSEDEEESEFFLTKKERRQMAKQKEKEKTESSEDEEETEFFLTKKERKQMGKPKEKENIEREMEEVEQEMEEDEQIQSYKEKGSERSEESEKEDELG